MNIEIYAPCKGRVEKLSDLKDGVFSEGFLGNGILFYPEEKDFYSVIKEGTLSQIFETKHAYFIKNESFENQILLHIGIDTVKLNGKPFKVKVKENHKINLNSLIVNVDTKFIVDNNISLATPITVVGDQEYEITNINYGVVNKGDVIFNITFKEVKIQANNSDLLEYKSKYELAAEQFINDVGGHINYKDVYNCMTRLRFSIIDKNKVNSKNIEKNKLVKGVVWNGLELQIVIGGECYKVKDEILKKQNQTTSNNEQKIKPPFSKRVLGVITAIMAPNVPIILASGILSAIYALFAATNLIDANNDKDMFSSIMKILSKTGLVLVGVFFCMNTVKYLGGNILLGALLGLLLVSRFYFQEGVTDESLYKFGTYIQNKNYGVSGWFLFNIGNFPVTIRSYEGSILPFILVGFLSTYVDKWIKTWMPSTIDVVFRYPLVIIITILPTLFILGPLLSLVEIGVAKAIGFVEDWPIGLGVGIFAFIIQPLVLMGVHVAVYVTLQSQLLAGVTGAESLILPGGQAAVWGQIGAAIGVLIMTKNWNFKSIIIGTLPSATFGITETILYSVNIPKGRPFLVGCISGAAGGIVMGMLGAKLKRLVGDGVLYPMGLDGIDQLYFIIGSLVSLLTGIILSIIFYKERIIESKYAKKVSNKLFKYISLLIIDNKDSFKKELESLNKKFVDCKVDLSKYEKYSQSITKVENKILKVEQKEENQKKKLFKQLNNLNNKKSNNLETKRNELVIKYNNYTLNDIKQKLTLEKQKININNKEIIDNYNNRINSLNNDVDIFFNKLKDISYYKSLLNFKNGYWNAIHSVDISYGYEDLKEWGLTKDDKKSIKEFISKRS
ncbi:PTS glucose transporter subunit IIA [Spiroplasma turonicum]|uniref:Beta-glucoside PTS system IIABC component n=1 Tax=Spiroplasma turonicum TaxID=216946 RepID=A0A0K1P6F5_9MOLU|nr:PTS glucose transporter subunit IIABC [Spiroplasma turonicum]AKU79865.1 beta-glucoside PTS system IIABC component [Spiroplasma turonicum]ALX70881.1 PTS system, beta-glucoside-specific IIABC component [Spiroplasma turonicum]